MTADSSALWLATRSYRMTDGYPAGWAAYDHWRKYGLRTRVMGLFGLTCEIMYGPVPGRNGARLMAWPGAPGGAAEGERQRELVQEVGVRLGQAEGDRTRRVAGFDPGVQVAPLRDVSDRRIGAQGLSVISVA